MSWSLNFLPEAKKDLKDLDGSQRQHVVKALDKTLQNPLPRSQGGYGIELGSKGRVNLTGFLEVKLRGEGLRAIYKLIHAESEMLVIIIGIREDEEVYNEGSERIKKYGL